MSDLWVQKKARSGVIRFPEVDGEQNPVDAFIKAVDSVTMERYLHEMGIIRLPGRPAIAPKAKAVEVEVEDAGDADSPMAFIR